MPCLVLNLFIKNNNPTNIPTPTLIVSSLYNPSCTSHVFSLGFLFFCEVSYASQKQEKKTQNLFLCFLHCDIVVLRYGGTFSSYCQESMERVEDQLFMMRKGLISKRKLIMDMNLMIKKGKLLRKSLGNLMSSHLHHHHSRSVATCGGGRGFGLQEYEFSCSNSPDPVFFRVPKRKQYHFNFPCINHPQVIEEEYPNKAVVLVPKTPEYTFNFRFDASDYLSPGDRRSPLQSPFSARISNYSSEDENEDAAGNDQVDHQAEDFIRRFYEQLRMQSRMQLLEYQEV